MATVSLTPCVAFRTAVGPVARLRSNRRALSSSACRSQVCMALKLVPSGDLTLDHLPDVEVDIGVIKEIPVERVRAVCSSVAICAGSINECIVPSAQDTFTVGRAPYNDVCIPIPTISGEHAKVEPLSSGSSSSSKTKTPSCVISPSSQVAKVEGGLLLTDLESTNGTFIDGEEIGAQGVLSLGQQVTFGDPHLGSFTLVDE
eukprot:scaffold912_cov422-Prasinococcus_capsulatus_cf.AAC.13